LRRSGFWLQGLDLKTIWLSMRVAFHCASLFLVANSKACD
jgi:hypothetical protein